MIRDEATQRQVDAADPAASTWLSANAGSGKTRVLTDRVARLLLRRVPPQNILCLTYTKAAAAEMQNRLFKRLGGWAMKADDPLRSELAALGIDGPMEDDALNTARTLFAKAIETPGGLKIQTIHAFCASILRRFPLEAGVSPQFREIEDRAAELLRTEVVDAMAMGPDRVLVHDVMRHFTGGDFNDLLKSVSSDHRLFAAPADRARIAGVLNLAPKDTAEQLIAEVFNADNIEILTDLIGLLATGSTRDLESAAILRMANLVAPTLADLAVLEGPFLYGEKAKNALGPKIGAIPTKKTAQAMPDLVDALASLMQLVADNRDRRLGLQALDRSLALHRFGHRFNQLYAARKQAMGLLDFDDLIEKAGQLLTDRTVADWVLFRLDGGIDHVLVDEAQDTSPAQWTVIENLTRELTSGVGARSNDPRTIFVVGDKKQSIYSFQGADPGEFDRMQGLYKTALAAQGSGLQGAVLEHSFRSSQAILQVVDATFAEDDKSHAIGGRDGFHIAFHAEMPGRVDLWPIIPASEKAKDPEDWSDPVDQVSDSHHDVQLARRVVAQIGRMIATETLPIMQDGQQARRPITAGDFLILVQRRSTLFTEIIRACKVAGLAVAGADRFRVGAVLAVKDIAALLRFLALPEDDLSLAAALRSPLFGWSEQDLYSVAQSRPEGSYLWEAVRGMKASDTVEILLDLRKQADFLRPYDLIDRILTRHDGRRNLLARLGQEAEDGIDAMLSQAMAYESMGVPSLTGFLSWMETDDLEVKRQMDSQGDQIRVMSVHGAKGLEAPIVILPDSGTRKNQLRDDILNADGTPIWKTNKPLESDALTRLREAQEDAQRRERLRLLYVAMTRAEQWLIVAAAGDLEEKGETWHELVDAGMARIGAYEAMAGDLAIQRVSHHDWDAGPLISPVKPVASEPPDLVLNDLPAIMPQRTRAPSDLGGAKALAGEVDDTDADTLKTRGRLLHLLLEHQPADHDNAVRIIAASPDSLDQATNAGIIADALRVLATPDLAHIFAPDTLAEVGITADLPGVGRINGLIDRLVTGPDTVLAVDFKSNRLVPERAEDTPEAILRQMGAYADALAQIYPNHRVETAILWTATATLMPLPTPIIAAALGRVTIS